MRGREGCLSWLPGDPSMGDQGEGTHRDGEGREESWYTWSGKFRFRFDEFEVPME